ncbi:hypothetical protein ACFX2C_007572 [Malus domestica]
MRTAAKGNQEEDEYDEEEFGSRKEGPSSNSNNKDAKNNDKASAIQRFPQIPPSHHPPLRLPQIPPSQFPFVFPTLHPLHGSTHPSPPPLPTDTLPFPDTQFVPPRKKKKKKKSR